MQTKPTHDILATNDQLMLLIVTQNTYIITTDGSTDVLSDNESSIKTA